MCLAYPEHVVPPSCPHLPRLLFLLLSGLPAAPTWLPSPTRLRLQQELTATNVQHGLVSHATTQPFLTFLLCFYTPCQEARAALLALPLAGAQLVTLVLLQARARELLRLPARPPPRPLPHWRSTGLGHLVLHRQVSLRSCRHVAE